MRRATGLLVARMVCSRGAGGTRLQVEASSALCTVLRTMAAGNWRVAATLLEWPLPLPVVISVYACNGHGALDGTRAPLLYLLYS